MLIFAKSVHFFKAFLLVRVIFQPVQLRSITFLPQLTRDICDIHDDSAPLFPSLTYIFKLACTGEVCPNQELRQCEIVVLMGNLSLHTYHCGDQIHHLPRP